jgi:hypothetical protein
MQKRAKKFPILETERLLLKEQGVRHAKEMAALANTGRYAKRSFCHLVSEKMSK